MKRQIRNGVFETNSSSTHSITICMQEDFDKWENGEVLFDEYGERFIPLYELDEHEKQDAANDYMEKKERYWKDWNDLSKDDKDEWYLKYAKENNLGSDGQTYDEYMNHGYLETFVDTFTTKNGDKVVAFGEYGYNG